MSSTWLLGTEADVVGFGLAGVDGEICATTREVKRAFAALDRATPAPALVLVSGPVAALAPDVVGDRLRRVEGPIVVVLP